MSARSALAFFLLSTAACSGVPSDRKSEPARGPDATEPADATPGDEDDARERPAAGLTATFETPTAAFESTSGGASLAFIVENHGPTPGQIDLDHLGSASLGLDVFDAAGRRIPTIPPGVPPANYQPRVETLAPGGSHRFEVDLNVFSPPLPAGTYTAEVRDQRIASEPVRFTIGGG